MMTVYENELLGFLLQRLGQGQGGFIERIGIERSDEIRQLLVAVLFEISQESDDRYLSTEMAHLPASRNFRSVVWRGGGYAGPPRIVAFNFRDAFRASPVSLIGLLIAAYGGPIGLALVPPALEVAKNLWTQLSVLEGAEHADAIALLDVMGVAKADALGAGSDRAPDWAELVARTGFDPSTALAALKVVRDRGIIEIEEWGDQAEAVDHPANRWRIKF